MNAIDDVALVPGVKVYFEPVDAVDCVLVYSGVEFHVHKVPLMRRAEYFKTVLSANSYDQKEPLDVPVPHTHLWRDDYSGGFGPYNELGPPVKVVQVVDACPADLLVALGLLYSDSSTLEPHTLPPSLSRHTDGRIITNGVCLKRGVTTPYTFKLPVAILYWMQQWGLQQAINWWSYQAIVGCPSPFRVSMRGALELLWVFENYWAPVDDVVELRAMVLNRLSFRGWVDDVRTLPSSFVSSTTALGLARHMLKQAADREKITLNGFKRQEQKVASLMWQLEEYEHHLEEQEEAAEAERERRANQRRNRKRARESMLEQPSTD
jgi:hypothetical protein